MDRGGRGPRGASTGRSLGQGVRPTWGSGGTPLAPTAPETCASLLRSPQPGTGRQDSVCFPLRASSRLLGASTPPERMAKRAWAVQELPPIPKLS